MSTPDLHMFFRQALASSASSALTDTEVADHHTCRLRPCGQPNEQKLSLPITECKYTEQQYLTFLDIL